MGSSPIFRIRTKVEQVERPALFSFGDRGVPCPQGVKVSSPQGRRRSDRWEKGPQDHFRIPPHPIIRIRREIEKTKDLLFFRSEAEEFFFLYYRGVILAAEGSEMREY